MKKIILAFGHSIIRTSRGTWMPSGIYQTIEYHKPSGKIRRTFLDQVISDPNSQNAYLGGGQAVVRALFTLWGSSRSSDVAFVGGRPYHMDKIFENAVSNISEATVQAKYFKTLFESTHSPQPEIFVKEGTRNTEDDMREILKLTKGYDQATVVAMSFRIFRAKLLMEEFVKNNQQFVDAASRLTFCSAEQFLPELFDEFVTMNQSAAYTRTMEQERSGVLAMLNGSGHDYLRTE